MQEYLRAALHARRKAPRQDLLSWLAEAEDDGRLLDDNELLGNCMSILFAGHETTTNLIGNGILALMEHPAQLHRLRKDRTLIALAIEEQLRFDSPLQWTCRRAPANMESVEKTSVQGNWLTA